MTEEEIEERLKELGFEYVRTYECYYKKHYCIGYDEIENKLRLAHYARGGWKPQILDLEPDAFFALLPLLLDN